MGFFPCDGIMETHPVSIRKGEYLLLKLVLGGINLYLTAFSLSVTHSISTQIWFSFILSHFKKDKKKLESSNEITHHNYVLNASVLPQKAWGSCHSSQAWLVFLFWRGEENACYLELWSWYQANDGLENAETTDGFYAKSIAVQGEHPSAKTEEKGKFLCKCSTLPEGNNLEFCKIISILRAFKSHMNERGEWIMALFHRLFCDIDYWVHFYPTLPPSSSRECILPSSTLFLWHEVV